MAKVCFYLQLHQPYRLDGFSLFQLGKSADFFGQKSQDINRRVFCKVAEKSYLPMLSLLYQLIKKHPEFVLALSCSGTFLTQAKRYQPQIITWLKKIMKTGQVEMLAETFYHSLASLYSPAEFKRQVQMHDELIQDWFGVRPQIFRNSELIYDNTIGRLVASMGYSAMLVEGVDKYLGDCKRTRPARHIDQDLILLLKNSQLSDDLAFRFSDRSWSQYPLTADKYLGWLDHSGPDDLINLFLDFETFGEHQWQDSGIFDFFTNLVGLVVKSEKHSFASLSTVCQQVRQLPKYDVPHPISWADSERDLTAWTGNQLQQDCLRQLYQLEQQVKRKKSAPLLETWGKLQTSDHFYYMCTKWADDGDVHAYFSPFPSPYEAYRQYSIVLSAFMGLLK